MERASPRVPSALKHLGLASSLFLVAGSAWLLTNDLAAVGFRGDRVALRIALSAVATSLAFFAIRSVRVAPWAFVPSAVIVILLDRLNAGSGVAHEWMMLGGSCVLVAPALVTGYEVWTLRLRVRDCFSEGLLAVTLALGAYHAWVAFQQTHSFDNDPSYYFGVARHIASSGTLTEPIVWHALTHPASVVHPAFDYWQGGTALLLVPWFRVFGASHAVAAVWSSIVGTLALVCTWYVATQTGMIRHRLVQLVVVVAVDLSPALANPRVDTETTTTFQFVSVLALVLLFRRRYVGCAAAASALVLIRADGAMTAAVLIGLAALSARTTNARLRVLSSVVAIGAALVLGYFVHFGVPWPPGVRAAATLRDYFDLYRWHREPLTSSEIWAQRTDPAAFTRAFENVQHAFADPLHVSVSSRVLSLSLVAIARAWFETRERRRWILGLVCVGVLVPLVNAWLSPVVFAHRSIQALFPVLGLVAGIGIDAAASFTVRSRAITSLARWGAAAFVVHCMGLVMANSRWGPFDDPVHEEVVADLHVLAPELSDSTVLTTATWWVLAETDAHPVLLPLGTTEDTIELARRYHADYVLIGGFEGFPGEDLARWRSLAGSTTGGLHFAVVPSRTRHFQLLHIDR